MLPDTLVARFADLPEKRNLMNKPRPRPRLAEGDGSYRGSAIIPFRAPDPGLATLEIRCLVGIAARALRSSA
mgnify:CR=1 FL=1